MLPRVITSGLSIQSGFILKSNPQFAETSSMMHVKGAVSMPYLNRRLHASATSATPGTMSGNVDASSRFNHRASNASSLGLGSALGSEASPATCTITCNHIASRHTLTLKIFDAQLSSKERSVSYEARSKRQLAHKVKPDILTAAFTLLVLFFGVSVDAVHCKKRCG